MYNKGQNYSLLKETYKVPETLLSSLKALGVSFKVGDTAIALDNGKGLAKEHSFNTLVSNTVKNPSPQHVVEVNAFVGNYINLANQSATLGIPSAPKAATPAAPKKVSVTQADANVLPVVKLRDAQALYQRVHGTSGGSIYRVVALNDDVKVAARIQGNAVSMRVEGVINSKIEQAFAPLGIAKKSNEYMSGHFNCEKCTPQKLIGSILAGAGLAFDTPMPQISKVME
jgi:hypothetical protein